jgi:hypothetical protein|tara:strand:- start:32 stop:820 length:789 start_codon:yes stop_codon:yes gene_type:complete
MAVGYNPKIIYDNCTVSIDPGNPKSFVGSGLTCFDMTGNGNDCVIGYWSGSQSVSQSGYGIIVGLSNTSPGYYDFSVFSGPWWLYAGQAVMAPSADFDLINNFSIEIWVNFENTTSPNEQVLIGKSDNDFGTIIDGWNIYTVDRWETIGWRLHTGTDYNALSSTNALTVNLPSDKTKWIHLMFTYDGSYQRSYVNGSLAGSRSQTGNVTSNPNKYFFLGAIPGATTPYFKGKLGILRIYKDKVFTASEVKQNFDALRVRYGV